MTPVEVARKLEELAARCEAAAGPDKVLNADILLALGWSMWDGMALDPDGNRAMRIPDILGSIDDAKTLVPEEWLVLTLSEVAGDGMAFAELANPFRCGTRMGIAKEIAPALAAAALRAVASDPGE